MIKEAKFARVYELWVVLTGLYRLNMILFVYYHDISGRLRVFVIHFRWKEDALYLKESKSRILE